MNAVVNAVRLHLNKRENFLLVPLYILGMVMVVTVVISFTLQRLGMDPSAPGFVEGSRMNAGIAWSLPGFIVYTGVQAVATTFPFALALGTTRRAFVLGTAIANALMALYITAVLALLLVLELATGHWFFNLYLIDVNVLGAGHLGTLVLVAFLGLFGLLSVGGLFGAAWVAYGSRGPVALGLGLGLLLAVGALVLAPQLPTLVAGITGAGLAVGGVAAIAVSLLGTWALMRRAAVR